MLAIIRELPNHVSILAIARVEVMDSRERCFREVGVVSAKEITVVVNDVDAVVEAPQFQLFLAISRRPVAKQSFRTFRVGADVIGTSYWQAVKATAHRSIATPTTRSQTKFDELTGPCSWLGTGLHQNR